MIIELSTTNFDAEVLHATEPVLVFFWSQWSGPDRMLMPIINQIATEMAGRAKAGRINVDDNLNLVYRFNVRSVPTLLFFKNGELVDTIVGATSKDNIVGKLKALL